MALVKIYVGREAMDAHHIRAILEDRGIAATVMGESLRLAWPQIPPTLNTQPAVWVNDTDVKRALDVIREGEIAEATPTQDWVCPKCGETVEPQFCLCWNCGTAQSNAHTA